MFVIILTLKDRTQDFNGRQYLIAKSRIVDVLLWVVRVAFAKDRVMGSLRTFEDTLMWGIGNIFRQISPYLNYITEFFLLIMFYIEIFQVKVSENTLHVCINL